MSDGQKQALTIVFIAVAAVMVCGGLLLGAFFLTGRVTEQAAPATPIISPNDGVLITAVLPESPAAQANLQPGHVLLKLNDEPITSPELLTLMLQNLPSEAEYSLLLRDEADVIRQTTAVRAAEPPYLGVEIRSLPQETPNPPSPAPPATEAPDPPPTSDAITIQLPVILNIVPDSPAANLDVQVRDIVTAVDGAAILNGEELLTAIANKPPEASVTLTLRRGEETLMRTLILAPHPDNAERGFLGIEIQP